MLLIKHKSQTKVFIMDLEKSVAELAGRVFLLEQRITEIEERTSNISSPKDKKTESKPINYNRRTEVLGMGAIKEGLETIGFDIVRGDARAESIQYLVSESGARFKACVSFSKSYDEDTFAGWNVLKQQFVSDNDISFFLLVVVNAQGESEVFVIPKADMDELLKVKTIDKRNNYHFAICLNTATGEWFDARNQQKKHVEMGKYRNAWNLIHG